MNEASDISKKGQRRSCAITTKCEPERNLGSDLMSGKWEEFVIRYDRDEGGYVTRTACCPGAPVCC